jgi:hypothetical protein
MLVCLGLSACQGFPWPGASAAPSQTPAAVVSQSTAQPTDTPEPTSSPTRPEAAQPTTTPTLAKTATPAGVPQLLKDFPLFAGAQVDPSGAYADTASAGLLIQTSKSPGELDAFYQQALAQDGWTLRYAEGNTVGGFLQEWRKDNSWLTVEYHFLENKPVVQADLRVIESKEALVVLLGFPLPNGTLVTASDGPSIELYVPQDFEPSVDYFLTTMYNMRWKVQDTKLDNRCGTRACQENYKVEYEQIVPLEPVPTADVRKAVSYLVTLPDRTQARITFSPHRNSTRVFVDVNWKNPHRAWLPIPPYPNGEIQAVKPYVMMFTTPDSLQTVIQHYQKGMTALGWKVDPDSYPIHEENEYFNTWLKKGQSISITLSRGKGTTYGTITCRRCSGQ